MDDTDHTANHNGTKRNGTTDSRKMVRSELLGQPTHQTLNGIKIHIWQRQGVYIARGYYQRQRFGEQIGRNEREAAGQLRKMMVEMEDGTWVRASERVHRPLGSGSVPRSSVRELCDVFLADKRRAMGKKTAVSYRDRLVPLIEFAEQPGVKKRWRLAADVDREFALEFKAFVATRIVTPNGRAAATEAPISPRQMYNILDCTRGLFNWGKNPVNNKLPAYFLNPFSVDIVGTRQKKDPLRQVVFPMERRIQLVEQMDIWQLTHLCIPFVLPLRPEDFTGLLIEEIDDQRLAFKFGTRFGGRDFNKTNLSFTVPYPSSLEPLMRICAGSRVAGPLLRKRVVFEGRRRPALAVESHADVESHIQQAFLDAAPSNIQTPQDQKELTRRTIRAMGGVAANCMSKEFKRLLETAGMPNHGRFYDLRGSVNSEMEAAQVSHLVQLYVTGHETGILGEYASLDPWAEMQKYFDSITPLLEALDRRGAELGLQKAGPA